MQSPPFDPVLMFKVLVIRTVNNLSDERAEYLIDDLSLSCAFCGLGCRIGCLKPSQSGYFVSRPMPIEMLFNRSDATLPNAGYLPMSAQTLDATLVAALKQHNTNGEKKDLRERHISEGWKDKSADPPHKDHHVRWTPTLTKARQQDKRTTPSTGLAILFFSYKSHVFVDQEFRLI
ncbi:transposase [Acetobacter senegalensis]|nr:transposase [Acetobacter senegalensis]